MKWFLLYPLPAVTFCLGCWQVKRLFWKLDLIEFRNSRAVAPAIELPDEISEQFLKDVEFCPIKVSGKFDHSKEQLIVPRFKEGEAGAHVLTPFELSRNGERILINRGWVPRNKQNPSDRLEGQIIGEVPITGLSRISDPKKPSYFTPENEPAKRMWFWLDLPSMAKHLNTREVLLEANDQPNPGGYPIGGQSVLSIRNQHLNYAVTWFSLTFFMCVSLVAFKKQAIGGTQIRRMVLGQKPR